MHNTVGGSIRSLQRPDLGASPITTGEASRVETTQGTGTHLGALQTDTPQGKHAQALHDATRLDEPPPPPDDIRSQGSRPSMHQSHTVLLTRTRTNSASAAIQSPALAETSSALSDSVGRLSTASESSRSAGLTMEADGSHARNISTSSAETSIASENEIPPSPARTPQSRSQISDSGAAPSELEMSSLARHVDTPSATSSGTTARTEVRVPDNAKIGEINEQITKLSAERTELQKAVPQAETALNKGRKEQMVKLKNEAKCELLDVFCMGSGMFKRLDEAFRGKMAQFEGKKLRAAFTVAGIAQGALAIAGLALLASPPGWPLLATGLAIGGIRVAMIAYRTLQLTHALHTAKKNVETLESSGKQKSFLDRLKSPIKVAKLALGPLISGAASLAPLLMTAIPGLGFAVSGGVSTLKMIASGVRYMMALAPLKEDLKQAQAARQQIERLDRQIEELTASLPPPTATPQSTLT